MTKKILITLTCCIFIFVFMLPHIVAAEVPSGQGSKAPNTQIPGGQTDRQVIFDEGEIGSDVFGKKGGILHPFLLLEGRWTDNLYAHESDEEEDIITTISPGVWIALPANREKLLKLGTVNTAPGGLMTSRIKPESTRRYQGYLLYAPEFVFYSENSQHDSTNHKLEGLFQYNFNFGLSLDIINQFNIRNEPNNNGISDRLDEFEDNVFNIIVQYETERRFIFRFDYSNYGLDYEDDINTFRDRMDDSFAFYVYYLIKPKTSIFVEYEFSNIDYDTNKTFDSEENRYFAGIKWDITAKTNGQFKIGYTEKDLDRDIIRNQDDLSLEIQMRHNFTPKRALTLAGYRKFHESSMTNSPTYLITGIDVALLQKFVEKWSGTFKFLYHNDDYNGIVTVDGVTDEREDDVFSLAPAIRYKLREWLTIDLAYIYTHRDSNFKRYDYEKNTVFLRMDASF